MPTYDYHCRACGHRFEVFHSMSADPVRECPECGEPDSVERMISGGSGLITHGGSRGSSAGADLPPPNCAPGGG